VTAWSAVHGAVFGLFGGMYYWWPKVFGRLLSELLGKLHFWLMLIGFNLTFFPMHFVGLNGMPRRTWTYPAELGFETLNQLETAGAFVLFLAFSVFLVNIFKTWRGPRNAPADPWNGATLEWAIPSPPPEWNFAEAPVVQGRDPLWETKRERGGRLRLVRGSRDADGEQQQRRCQERLPISSHEILPRPLRRPVLPGS